MKGSTNASVVATSSNRIIADYTLYVDNWVDNEQTITIVGKNYHNHAHVSDSNTGTNEEVLANSRILAEANIYRIKDNGTSLTFVCENIPTSDIKVQVEVN